MGSHINFKNFGATTQPESSASQPSPNFSLARQSSVYSLTFDELQNTLDGVGKDFGSMNMDELLKSIWIAEGTQPMASSGVVGEGTLVSSGNVQSQGSWTLPRTLSQKTVEEVWRDLLIESENLKDSSASANASVNGGANLQQKQANLGEMTLEEFLLKAGVVGETAQPIVTTNNTGYYGDIPQNGNSNAGLTFEFQKPESNHEPERNGILENNVTVHNPSHSLALNGHGVVSQQQLQQQHQQQQQQQQQQQPQQQLQRQQQQLHRQQQQHSLFPKQATLAFASPLNMTNSAQVTNQGTRGAIGGRVDQTMNNSAAVQTRVMQNEAMPLASLAPLVTPIAAGSPKNQLVSNMIPKSDVETSLSPSPYAFNEGTRVRKSGGTLEKVVERRRRRMIKNRESAARSRARKQAYTLELEAEIAKLKEVNEDMQKKQEEFLEMQKDQIKLPWKSKRLCLRRTLTGPW